MATSGMPCWRAGLLYQLRSLLSRQQTVGFLGCPHDGRARADGNPHRVGTRLRPEPQRLVAQALNLEVLVITALEPFSWISVPPGLLASTERKDTFVRTAWAVVRA